GCARHDHGTGVILGGDQFDVGFLAVVLTADSLPELGVRLLQGLRAAEHETSAIEKVAILARHAIALRCRPALAHGDCQGAWRGLLLRAGYRCRSEAAGASRGRNLECRQRRGVRRVIVALAVETDR